VSGGSLSMFSVNPRAGTGFVEKEADERLKSEVPIKVTDSVAQSAFFK